ncbi:unnamed protein product [Heterobilharzia americana]|nr:unnamed protein product [Heterobilharzia americana]
MSSRKATSSQCNVTTIPTICVDSNLELVDGYDGSLCAKSEEDFYIIEEQTFGINELYYLSRLSCISNHKKFLIAIALLSQCGEGYRFATQQWLSNTRRESKEGPDKMCADLSSADYIKNLCNTSLSNSELLKNLKKLIPFVGQQYSNMPCQYSRHDSVPNRLESDHIEYFPETHAKNVMDDLPHDIESVSQNFLSTKRQYLELVSKSFVSSLIDDHDALIKEVHYNHVPLREVAVQTSIGQLFISTILHTSFNEDDRKWLLSSIRSKYKALSGENNVSQKQNSIDDSLRSKLFDCLIDLGLDLTCALQRMTSDSSLSHSLTSSGFLSGSGGSDSQYDLLMEASNSGSQTMNPNNGMNSTKANYGTLLTVPNADVKCGLSSNFCNNHSYCLHPINSSSHHSYRRLSDIPNVSNFHSTSSSQHHTHVTLTDYNQENKTSKTIDSGANPIFASKSKDFLVVSPSDFTSVQTPAVDVASGQINLSPNDTCQQRASISTLSDSRAIAPSNPDPSVCISQEVLSVHKSPEPVESYKHLMKYNGNSPSQFLVGTSEGDWISDSPYSTAAEHSNLVNDRHLSSLNINIHPHPVSQGHHHEELPDNSMNFSEVQDESAHFGPSVVLAQLVNSHDGRHISRYVSEENNFLNPSSGMTAVPHWLKSLRLHKYAGLFQNLLYDEMMDITDDWLKEHDVTQGARNKILLSIERLKHRKSVLCGMEKRLSEVPSTGQLARAALHSCLSEIKYILLTPIKPSFESTAHSMHLCQPVGSPSSSSDVIGSRQSSVMTTNTRTNSTHLMSPITVTTSTDNANNTGTVNNTVDGDINDNNGNNKYNCSTNVINSVNNIAKDSTSTVYYCFCNAYPSCAESSCYLNEEQQQHHRMTTPNQIFHENKSLSPPGPNVSLDISYGSNRYANSMYNNIPPSLIITTESKKVSQNKEEVGSSEYDDTEKDDSSDKYGDGNIPGCIINCLTKVCSGLLVNAYPDANLCEEFLQILEIILNHVAFSEQQKKLVLFWKHRVIAVYGQYLTHPHTHSSKSKSDSCFNFCPRPLSQSNYSDNRIRKIPNHCVSHERAGFHQLAYKPLHANGLSPSGVCFHNAHGASCFTLDTSDLPHPFFDAGSVQTNLPMNVTVSTEVSRRHSISVGDSQNHLAVGKQNNRRRMPSPNLSCFPSRNVIPINPNSNTFAFPHHPQASSEMELSGYPSQLPRPRFHSPSRFDPSTNIAPRRNLMPLATAPVTRMPSPSDVCRNSTSYTDWFFPNNRSGFPIVPFTSSISPLSACEGSCSNNTIPDTHLFQQVKTSNVPFRIFPHQDVLNNTYGSCSCLPPTKAMTHQTLMLSPPNYPKIANQSIHPPHCGTSKTFLSASSYSSISCISNPVFTNNLHSVLGSSYKSSFGEHPSHNVDHCGYSPVKSTQLYLSEPQEMNIPAISCWSANFCSNQNMQNQTLLQGFQSVPNDYDPNNSDNNKDLLVFVDNYIATPENTLMGDPSESSNDRINRDLDLLTREVTEHAIGERLCIDYGLFFLSY